jgi:predicted dehydrogenase
MSALRVAVVGLRMGYGHASVYANLPEYKLAALCDIDEEWAKEKSAEFGGIPYYTSYVEMLDKEKPDIVNISTPNNLHCEMTLQAAERGVKGIYCEKPIAMNMKEARAMQDACKAKGIPLVVGHQRRLSEPYTTMRKAIDDGLIGDVYLMRGICAGDFLSDGTHTVDSLMYLNGDSPVEWVLGQIYRGPHASEEEQQKNKFAYVGKRFGHNVERGAMSSFQLANGVRCETISGDQMLMPGRWYQDIEVFGSKGRIWRNNDGCEPPVRINTCGEWKELPLISNWDGDSGLIHAHKMFADTVRTGAAHGLSMDVAMIGFEIVMSVYESARLNARIIPPLTQGSFPLDLMLQTRGDF